MTEPPSNNFQISQRDKRSTFRANLHPYIHSSVNSAAPHTTCLQQKLEIAPYHTNSLFSPKT